MGFADRLARQAATRAGRIASKAGASPTRAHATPFMAVPTLSNHADEGLNSGQQAPDRIGDAATASDPATRCDE